MDYNVLILVFMALFSAALVVAAWKVDKERLYSVIVIFLILIAIGGGQIVEFFGFATNTGNVFYGSVFLATYFLIERYGKREGIRSIWVGVIGVAFFSVLLQMVLAFTGSSATAGLEAAFTEAFGPIARLTFASLSAYAISQTLNVHLYLLLKEKFAGRHLWLRANAANAVAQVVDSFVFFTIAFMGVVPPENIYEVMIVGFVIKVVFMMLAAPLLRLNRVEHDSDKGYSSVTVR